AQLPAQRLRGLARLRAGEAGGHVEGLDEAARLVRADLARIPMGDEEGERRIAPTGQRNPQHLERPGLLEIVAHPQRQRVQQVLAECDATGAAAVWARKEEAAVGGDRVAQALATGGDGAGAVELSAES